MIDQYHSGHTRGFREGLNDNAYEQDFAYHHADYERGYWVGFKEGIAARVKAKTIYPQPEAEIQAQVDKYIDGYFEEFMI